MMAPSLDPRHSALLRVNPLEKSPSISDPGRPGCASVHSSWGFAMEYRSLGRTGLKVSELCLGAMTFGRECSEALSRQILDRFVEAGGTFIDTADVYSRGVSEEILGRWLKGKDRESLVIATKVRFGTDQPNARRPNRFGLGRKHIMAEVDESLRRLQADYIDLYQVHMWDPNAPLRGNAEHPRRSRPPRQGPLPRRQQLQRLAAAEVRRYEPQERL